MPVGVNPDVDVLIVGSGPVGSAYARAVHERAPGARILMLEAGPQLTRRVGVHPEVSAYRHDLIGLVVDRRRKQVRRR